VIDRFAIGMMLCSAALLVWLAVGVVTERTERLGAEVRESMSRAILDPSQP
jgi:hypothetical protein